MSNECTIFIYKRPQGKLAARAYESIVKDSSLEEIFKHNEASYKDLVELVETECHNWVPNVTAISEKFIFTSVAEAIEKLNPPANTEVIVFGFDVDGWFALNVEDIRNRKGQNPLSMDNINFW